MAAAKTGPHKPMTVATAQSTVEDFEFLRSTGCTVETACERMSVHPRTVQRHYALLGRRWPEGLSGAARRLTRKPTPVDSEDDWVDPDDREMAMDAAIAAFNREFEQEAS